MLRLLIALIVTAVAAGYGAAAAVDVFHHRIAAVPLTSRVTAPSVTAVDPTPLYLDEATAPPPSAPPTPDASASPLHTLLTGAGGPHVVVPILCYHYVRVVNPMLDRAGFGLSVTPANFAAQMKLLYDVGAHPVTLDQVMSAMSGGPQLPFRPVALTFDDGYADFATTAVPTMRQYGFHATAYVVSGFIGRSNYMTAAQVLDVMAAGMVIGAHTVDHIALAHTSPAVARNEIVVSRQTLQQLTGATVDDFAYPYGDFNFAVEQLVKDAGFRDAVTTNAGSVQYLSQRFELRRIRVGGYDSLGSFAYKAGVPASGGAGRPAPASPSTSPAATPSAQPSATPTPGTTPTPTPTPIPDPTPTPHLAADTAPSDGVRYVAAARQS